MTQQFQATVHIKEMYVHPVYGRIFEGWMSGGALNVFGSLAHTQCAMTSQQAIEYRLNVEKCAFEWNNATKFDGQGNPSFSTVMIEYAPEFLP